RGQPSRPLPLSPPVARAASAWDSLFMTQPSNLTTISDPSRKAGLRLVVLLNAGAGSASQRGVDGLRNLAAQLTALDVATDLEFCPGADLKHFAEGALARAEAAEIDAVVVGGGDGSIRTVAGVLSGTNVPLGILPLGTLNHFAKDLGIPLHLKEA